MGRIIIYLILILTNRSCFAQLSHANLIALGESSHGYDTINYLRLELLESIIKNKNISTIYFESPLIDGVCGYFNNYDYNYHVYPFWSSESFYPVFSNFLKHNNIKTLGFDPQENCNFRQFSSYLKKHKHIEINKYNLFLLAKMDSLLNLVLSDSIAKSTKRFLSKNDKENLVNTVLEIKSKVICMDSIEFKLINLCLDNRIFLAEYLTIKNQYKRVLIRDKQMADNLIRLLSIFYTDNSINVLWAASAHLAKENGIERGIPSMMELFLKTYKQNCYIINYNILPQDKWEYKRSIKYAQFDETIIIKNVIRMNSSFIKYKCE